METDSDLTKLTYNLISLMTAPNCLAAFHLYSLDQKLASAKTCFKIY